MFKGSIYFIKQNGINDAIKIGYSFDLESKLKSMLSFFPFGYNIEGVIYTDNPMGVIYDIYGKIYNSKICMDWYNISESKIYELVLRYDESNIINKKFRIENLISKTKSSYFNNKVSMRTYDASIKYNISYEDLDYYFYLLKINKEYIKTNENKLTTGYTFYTK